MMQREIPESESDRLARAAATRRLIAEAIRREREDEPLVDNRRDDEKAILVKRPRKSGGFCDGIEI
jgi:hypothetical protein